MIDAEEFSSERHFPLQIHGASGELADCRSRWRRLFMDGSGSILVCWKGAPRKSPDGAFGTTLTSTQNGCLLERWLW